MFTKHVLYNLLLYIYIFNLVVSFARLNNINFSRTSLLHLGRFSMVLVWFLELVILFGWGAQFSPLFSQVDSLFLYAWVIITFSLLVEFLYRKMDLFIFCANVLGFLALILNLFLVPNGFFLQEALLSELLLVHLSLAVVAYVSFTLSSLCSLLYLINRYLLKSKKWNIVIITSPSLARLNTFAFTLMLLGFFSGTTAFITGLISSIHHTSCSPNNIKLFLSLFILGYYGLILYFYRRKPIRTIAWCNVGGAIIISAHYIIVSWITCI